MYLGYDGCNLPGRRPALLLLRSILCGQFLILTAVIGACRSFLANRACGFRLLNAGQSRSKRVRSSLTSLSSFSSSLPFAAAAGVRVRFFISATGEDAQRRVAWAGAKLQFMQLPYRKCPRECVRALHGRRQARCAAATPCLLAAQASATPPRDGVGA